MAQQVRIVGTGQLIELSRRLRAAGGTRLRSNLHRRVRRAAEPLHTDLQGAIRSLPISSPGRKAGSRGGPSPTTRPLRATIAQAIRITVRTTGAGAGARVWVDKDRLPNDLRNMAAVTNSGRIRHPVFGNRKRWAQQNAPYGWWDKTVPKHTPRMERQIARILNDVKNDLT